MYENELIMFSLGFGLSILIAVNYSEIRQLPSARILLSAFFILLLAWLLTILEGFLFENLFNVLEHLCYAVSSILVAIWCRKVFKRKREVG